MSASLWNPNRDPFVGTWELDPAILSYEFGRLGRRAIYEIEASAEGLIFTLNGEDADGKAIRFQYGGALDGTEQPLAGGDSTLRLVLQRTSLSSIESVLKRGEQVLDRWVREISPDGQTIQMVQHVRDPNGGEFRNSSVYRQISKT